MCQVADRFYAAVRVLTGDGPQKQRLVSAYVTHLESLPADDVPDSIRPRFEALRQAMNAVPPTERETSVQVSVRKMSQAEAARWVRSTVAMFAELVRVKTNGDRLSAGDQPKGPQLVTVDGEVRHLPTFLAR